MTDYTDYSEVVSATTEALDLNYSTLPGIVRLYIHAPAVMLAARVNQAAAVYPLAEITFDGVTTGAFGNVQPGMTLLLGTAAGRDDLGRQYIRKAATSNTLYVGRSSNGTHDGELSVADNAYITVLWEYRVWARAPRIDPDGTVYKDHDLEVEDNTVDPPPVANAGPGFAGTVDAGGTLIGTFPPGANTSFATAPGASITTYLWTLNAGASFAGGSLASDSQVDIEFTPGFHWVALTVTDSNGKTHKARAPVYARDPAADTTIHNFTIETHRITKAGQQLSVKVLENIPAATYPDGALVMLWEAEPTAPDDRSHMLFIGWHDTDPAQIVAGRTATLKDTTLNCVDVAGRLNKLPGFPQTVTSKDTPTKWIHMADPNMDLYLHYLIHWHSTALELADWQWTGTGADYQAVEFSSDGESLWAQVSRRARMFVPNYELTCNTLGQLATLVDPMLQAYADRTATIQITLDETDYSEIRFTHQRPPPYHWQRGNAVLSSPTEIVGIYCIAPGSAPGQGEGNLEQNYQLAKSQEDLNITEGHRYERANAPDGHYMITLAAGDRLGLEPANMTWVSLTIGATTAAQRGQAFTAARGLLHEISIRYQQTRTGLVKTVDLEWEKETIGLPAVIDTVIVTDTDIPAPEFDVPLPGDSYYWPTPPTPTGMGTVYIMTSEKLWRTRDFSAGSPVWEDIGPTPISGNSPFRDFILDPWLPGEVAYLASHDGIYKSTDMDTATPTFNLVLTEADIETETGQTLNINGQTKLVASIDQQNYLAYCYGVDNFTRYYCAVSEDGGATWTHTLIDDTGANIASGGAAFAIADGSMVLYWADSSSNNCIWTSTDKGYTWTQAGTFPDSVGRPRVIHVPHDDNASGDLLYVGFSTQSPSTTGYVYKSVDGGGTFTDVRAVAGRGTGQKRTGIETYTNDQNKVIQWVQRVANETEELWISDDAGASWTQAAAAGLGGGTSNDEWVMATSGFPYNDGQYYVLTQNQVYVSTDGGATFVDKTGSINALTDLDWFFLEHYANAVIVPLWTE